MTKKLIHGDAVDGRGRLHCDNIDCGHILPKALPFNESLIGHRCPKCGSDMLTRVGYDRSMAFVAKIAWINRWFGWLGSEDRPKGRYTSITVRHTPTGVDIKSEVRT